MIAPEPTTAWCSPCGGPTEQGPRGCVNCNRLCCAKCGASIVREIVPGDRNPLLGIALYVTDKRGRDWPACRKCWSKP